MGVGVCWGVGVLGPPLKRNLNQNETKSIYYGFLENCFESPNKHRGEPRAQSDESLK